MAKNDRVAALTYNGVDGACAAAMVLLKFPAAQVYTTSANRIGETFSELARGKISVLHVCGLGVWCPWAHVEAPAKKMVQNGTRIYWHCGRGYLDDKRSDFAAFCEPDFVEAGTNTNAVAKRLGLTDLLDAHFLTGLAWFDPHVEGAAPEEEMDQEQADWVDLITASLGQYFKYNDNEPYLETIRKLAQHSLSREDRATVEHFRRTGDKYVLHGQSPVLRQVRERIKKVADADRHVIITGESGVGKEHVAHLIRERSRRSMGPFVPVNCALYAGSANLANSDLFGHVKGAFTGADSDRKGKFVEADKGILYLDELGDLPLEVQAKLLRVLEDGWITPEGADSPRKCVDVRIVSATNMDLPAMIKEGTFRMDLFHRLATLRVHVPALRERTEDIDTIVYERLGMLEAEGCVCRFDTSDLDVLREYPWPGNVRQLIKVIESACLLDMKPCQAIEEERAFGELAYHDGSGAQGRFNLEPLTKADVLPIKEIQRIYAHHVWELYDRNYSAAARALGVKPNTLRYSYLANE